MKPNKEQIIKALENCQKLKCQSCTYDVFGNPLSNCRVKKHALSLIKELTEEVERLNAVLASTVAAWDSDRAELHQLRLRLIEPHDDSMRCCYTCAHCDARAGDDPCRLCDNNNKWEPN